MGTARQINCGFLAWPFVQNQRSPLAPSRGALQVSNSAINAEPNVPEDGADLRARHHFTGLYKARLGGKC
jgi:hypothetical protein